MGRLGDTVYQSHGRRKYRRSGKVHSTVEGTKKRKRRKRLAIETASGTDYYERIKLMRA